ncbi:FAD-dependent monooxygenase [Nocardia sp. alder85J]|uniref:FAD-dependent monooxygenase n=1 Tax=Nocardia sp. alder85J TaxID=2862949 RepID=UPI001CD765F8|nr:FAD-dependent monooxygenase [Nocardia sp. alder85J]MCX4097507.1 FAD-dependent monooxygenase [Nocardia sp. alder85J]
MGTEHASTPEVLVVGAGPVGMVIACDLLQQGFSVRIIDTSPSSTLHSRAVITWPRSLELLRRIGVADELAETGAHLDAVSYYSGRRRLGAIDISRLTETPYPFALCAPQSRTEDVIRRRLKELGGHIEYEVTLTGLDNSGDRPVAELTGAGGGRETVRPDWLIGADGSHSAVRAALGIEFRGTGQDILFAICDAPLTGELPPHEMLYCYSNGGAMGLAPFGDGGYRVACAVPVWNDDDAPPWELFRDNLDRIVPFRTELGELRWTTVFRARRRTAARFRSGRCFLVGDAAHIFSAAGSQGMNTGIQDAINLGWKLAGVRNGTLHEGVLDTYDPERRHSAERISLVTAKQTSWGLLHKPAQVAIRDTLVLGAQRTGALQRLVAPLMSQLTVDYADNREHARADIRWRSAPVRAGLRLTAFPGEPAEDGWPTVAADRLTLLLWAGRARDAEWQRFVAATRAAAPDTLHLVDASGWRALAPALGRVRTALLVRPDGHIAAVQRAPRIDLGGLIDAAALLPDRGDAVRAGTAA